MSKLERIRGYLPFMAWLPLLDRSTLRGDVVAGITAGVLILPQAIALATLAGVPPEYGLYTAIFPVMIVALFGSSYQSLSGPNTALAVLTAMTIAPFANVGTHEYVQYAITLTFMAGMIQLCFGVLRLGAIFNYFSNTVMVAIVTGVGIIIVIQQVGNFMGVVMNLNEDIHEVLQQIWIAAGRANWYAVGVGAITVVSGLLIRRYRPKWPHYIFAVIIGMLAAQIVNLLVGSATARIDMLGYMELSALPFSAPDFRPESFAEFSSFAYPSAIGMAMLGLMQSAVIARSLAAKTGQKGLDINQEVVGQGLSNVGGSFLSCFVSCGSFNRSAANLEAGAKTPLAGLVSAFALAGLVIIAAPIIAWMPISVMAGVLFLVGAALVKVSEIKHLLAIRGNTRIVFLLVLAATLLSGVDTGVYLGIFLSIVSYLRGMSRPDVATVIDPMKDNFLLPGMPADQTTTISISGSLFFGSASHLEKSLTNIALEDGRKKHLLILGNYLNSLDISGANTLAQEALKRKANGLESGIWLRKDLLRDKDVIAVLNNAFGEDNVVCSDRRSKPRPDGIVNLSDEVTQHAK